MSKRPRKQKQQLIFQEKEQEQPQQLEQEQKPKEEEPKPKEEQKQEFTIIINEGYCVRERKLLKSKSNPSTVYKIEHNVWFNRARRRWKKSQHFSDMA